MMEENLFAYVEQSAVKHAASQIYVKKMSQKKRKKRKKEWHLDGPTSQVQVCQFFIQKFHVLH